MCVFQVYLDAFNSSSLCALFSVTIVWIQGSDFTMDLKCCPNTALFIINKEPENQTWTASLFIKGTFQVSSQHTLVIITFYLCFLAMLQICMHAVYTGLLIITGTFQFCCISHLQCCRHHTFTMQTVLLQCMLAALYSYAAEVQTASLIIKGTFQFCQVSCSVCSTRL